MQKRSLMGRFFAMSLALGMTVAGLQGAAAEASAAAKKPKLAKSKVNVTVGKTAKIKVKNANKKVKWSNNKTKYVKITKTSGKKKETATIKGLKKGSAVITAKVGKKSLKCKVTIKAASAAVTTNIKSVEVDKLDTSCLVLTMKKAQAVNVSDLTISRKRFKDGTYNFTPTVKTITSDDQTTYRVYLNSGISNGAFYKVAVGKDEYTGQYLENLTVDKDLAGEALLWEKEVSDVYSCGRYFNGVVGTCKYELVEGTLPAGLTLNTKRGIIKGIPTTVGETTVTIKATDEMKRTAEAQVTFKVYDKTTIVSNNATLDVKLDKYVSEVLTKIAADPKLAKTMQTVKIKPQGGSGNYKFTLASDTPEAELSTDVKDEQGQVTQKVASSTNLKIPFSITEGAHTFTITVTDAADAAKTCTSTVTVNAVKYYNVKGEVKDVNSAALSGNRLYFIPKDAESMAEVIRGRTYYAAGEYDYSNDEYGFYVNDLDYTARVGTSDDAAAVQGTKKGTFSAELPAGEYIVKISSGTEAYEDYEDFYYQMSNNITVDTNADQIKDVAVPVRFYSVKAYATYANTDVKLKNTFIYFETKEEEFEGASFYVKTDAEGMFTASLPSNSYVAYIWDEFGHKKYFNVPIEVNAEDVTLQEFKLDISRFTVSGTVAETMADNTTQPLVKGIWLSFYRGDGRQFTSAEVGENGAYTVDLEGTADAPQTYVVRRAWANGYWTIGEVTVAGASQTLNLTHSIATEILQNTAAVALTVGTPSPVTMLNKDVICKFTTGAPEAGNDENWTEGYEIKVDVSDLAYDDYDRTYFYLYDETGSIVSTDYYYNWEKNTRKVVMQQWLTPNKTYYVKFVTFDYNGDQKAGNISVSVEKKTFVYDE